MKRALLFVAGCVLVPLVVLLSFVVLWLDRRLAAAPVESPDDVLLARMQARADASEIARVLTREESAAIDRMVGL